MPRRRMSANNLRTSLLLAHQLTGLLKLARIDALSGRVFQDALKNIGKCCVAANPQDHCSVGVFSNGRMLKSCYCRRGTA